MLKYDTQRQLNILHFTLHIILRVNSFISIFTDRCRVKNEEEPEEQILNLEDTARQYRNEEDPEVLILNPADSARQSWLKNDVRRNKNAEHGTLLKVSEINSQPFREQGGYTPLNQHSMVVRLTSMPR